MANSTRKPAKQQGSAGASEIFTHRLYTFSQSLLFQLSRQLDRRLVKTFFDLLLVILIHRHRQQGLVLSELGGQLLGMDRAPAGTKRIAKLLLSRRWQAELIEKWMWEQGDLRVQQGQSSQEERYAIWDESELEKPESLKPERLCPVRSVKARRLKRIKKGYYNPPKGRPTFVPGFHWFQVVVTGLTDAPSLAHFHWWTTRGQAASQMRDEEGAVLKQLAQRWGRCVIHIWDRGFAGAAWLLLALFYNLRFIVRWKKGNCLIDEQGQVCKASEISRRKRSIDHRLIYDCKNRCYRKTGIVFFPVCLPDAPHHPLWMVVSRPGPGRQPWFLLTNEPVHGIEQAWRIVLAYNHRWQIETCIRFEKSELGLESIRLVSWSARLKLILMAAMLHAFLISLLVPAYQYLRAWLFSAWCHRTGKRCRSAVAPLYRLRLALSALWQTHRPFCLPRLN